MHKILIYECSLKKKNPNIGSSLAVQWLGFGAFTDMVQLLVGELRSHKSQSAIKKKKKANILKQGNSYLWFYYYKQWLTLFWGAPKSLQMVTAAMKLKDTYSLEGKL